MMKYAVVIICLSIYSCSPLEARAHSEGFIKAGNDSIYYESAGTGRTIVFIHDGVLPGVVWNSQFKELSGSYHLVRYDRRGYGKSSAARGDYTHLEDLHTLFEELGIENATLVGASSGGALAIDFTLKYPEKVNSLVLVGAVVGGFSYTEHMRTRGGHLPETFEDDTEENFYYVMEDPYLIWKGNQEAKMKAMKIVKDYPARIIDRPRPERAEIMPYKRLNEIKVPALILAGEYDIPDVHACTGVFDACIPDSRRYIIPDCGHLVALEQPALFNEAVIDFMY